jgi:hypothetical protein
MAALRLPIGALLAGLTLACGPSDAGLSLERASTPAANASAEARTLRDAALQSARVWAAPTTPISEANLRVNGEAPGGFDESTDVQCRFSIKGVSGTTPKFYCDLPGGETVKVKYGHGNPELSAEVAASRLLNALGFPADRMFVVKRVRCAGCPTFPFQALRCYARVGLHSACFAGGVDYQHVVDFDWAVIERKLPGAIVEAFDGQGWAWYELDRIDPARGGSSVAEVDALRLLAVFLAHWDNKAPNQRLICPAAAAGNDAACAQPLAIIQDLGATFGPLKLDLHNWRSGRIWKDGATCTVSMEHLPWSGATFPERRISEAGRRLLLQLLEQLSDQQLRDLFEGSRVTSYEQYGTERRPADAWVAAFKARVAQIRQAGPCPS